MKAVISPILVFVLSMCLASSCMANEKDVQLPQVTHQVATLNPGPGWTRNLSNLIINPSHFSLPTGELGFNTSDPCVLYSEKTKTWHAFFSSNSDKLDKQFLMHATSQEATNGWRVLPLPALDVGAANSWDAKTIETCSIVEIEPRPTESHYYLFYSGANTMGGGDEDVYSMGLAVSTDLQSFHRIDASRSPKKTDGLLFDPVQAFRKTLGVTSGVATDPSVIYKDSIFKMWFFCAAKDKSGEFIDGGICYASSADGLNWQHEGALPTLMNDKAPGVIAQQPTVIYNPQSRLYEMWAVIDDPAYASYGIGGLAVGGYFHATSPDGLQWTYTDKTAYDFKWDSTIPSENKGMGNGPSVVYSKGIYYLFYSSFTDQQIPTVDYPPFTWGLNLAIKN